MQKRNVALSVIAVAIPACVAANEAMSLQEVKVQGVVQATMSNAPIDLQPQQVTILSREEMSQSKPGGGIQGVLEKSPGIVYSRSGGVNGQISMRGQNSNNGRSMIMIDGVRFSGRSTLEFNTLDPNSFDEAEIIRGPASSLWGSDAMNGVINFKSRRSTYNANGESFAMTARVRSLEYATVNQYFSGRLELLGGGKGWDVLVGIGARGAQDYKTPIKEKGSKKALNSEFETLGLDFNIGYTIDETRYFLQGRQTKVASHRAGGLGAAPGSSYGILMSEDPIREQYWRVGLERKNLSFADSMEAYLSYRQWDTDIWNDRRKFNKAYIHQEVNNNDHWNARIAFNGSHEKHSFTYGGEVSHTVFDTPIKRSISRGKSFSVNRPSSFTGVALFAKDDYAFSDDLFLSASLRGDYIVSKLSKDRADFERSNIAKGNKAAIESARLIDENQRRHDQAITGAVGTVYFLNDNLSHVFNLSHNFRNPDTRSRMNFTPSGSATITVANPTLEPEYSQTAEFGFRYQSEDHAASLVGFYTRYSNMISLSTFQSATAGAGGAIYQNRNIGKAYITGIELEGKHRFFEGSLLWSYNLSYNYAQNKSDNKPLAYVAPLHGQTSLTIHQPRWYFTLTERGYQGKRRIDPKEERRHGSYFMTDLLLGVKLEKFNNSFKDMELMMGVTNLFDKVGRNPVTVESVSHRVALSNPLVEPGRNFFMKYVWKY